MQMLTTVPDSYVPPLTIYSDCIDIIIDLIQVTLDRIVLVTFYISFQNIDNLLKVKGKILNDTGITNKDGSLSHVERIRTYLLQGKRISILYDTYHSSNEPQMLRIILDEPDGIMMEAVNGIFNTLKIVPFVSKIEIAWDFYTNQVLQLKDWMEGHLWLCHNRKGFSWCEKTSYISDLRQSVKGIRIYPRPKDAIHRTHLRLELELHRAIIKRLGIQLPITSEQLPSDFAKFFRFCQIDFEKLEKAHLRANGLHRGEIKRNASHRARYWTGDLLRQQFSSDVRSIRVEYSSLVEKMERVKGLGLSNPTRFMDSLDEISLIINKLAQDQGFCL